MTPSTLLTSVISKSVLNFRSIAACSCWPSLFYSPQLQGSRYLYAARRDWPYSKWIPSGVAFAIGFLNTPSFSLARLVVGHVYRTRVAKGSRSDICIIVIASGFVPGEGVISIVSLILGTSGVGVVICVGCGPGLCGCK